MEIIIAENEKIILEAFTRIKNKIKKITNVKSNNDNKNHLKRN